MAPASRLHLGPAAFFLLALMLHGAWAQEFRKGTLARADVRYLRIRESDHPFIPASLVAHSKAAHWRQKQAESWRGHSKHLDRALGAKGEAADVPDSATGKGAATPPVHRSDPGAGYLDVRGVRSIGLESGAVRIALKHQSAMHAIAFRTAEHAHWRLRATLARLTHLQPHPRPASRAPAGMAATSASGGSGATSAAEGAPTQLPVTAPEGARNKRSAVLETSGQLQGLFYITVAMGTPMQELHVQFDTGSSAFWVSCDCVACPARSDVLTHVGSFQSRLSSSVSRVECGSPTCKALHSADNATFTCGSAATSAGRQSATSANERRVATSTSSTRPSTIIVPGMHQLPRSAPLAQPGSCAFSVAYADGSTAQGPVLSDFLWLPPSLDKPSKPDGISPGSSPTESAKAMNMVSQAAGLGRSMPGHVAFGCGRRQTGSLVAAGTAVDGVMGMSTAPTSALAQLNATGVLPFSFAFCLDSIDEHGSYVILGQAPYPPIEQLTPLLRNPYHPNTFYFVALDGISVGEAGKALPSSVGVSDWNEDGSGGVAIDAGTGLTILPNTLYSELLTEIQRAANITFERAMTLPQDCVPASLAPPLSAFPDIALSFRPGGESVASAVWKVKPESYLVDMVDGEAQVLCFGALGEYLFAPSIIIGQTWLSDTYVLIDVEQSVLGWMPTNCSDGSMAAEQPRRARTSSVPPKPHVTSSPQRARRIQPSRTRPSNALLGSHMTGPPHHVRPMHRPHSAPSQAPSTARSLPAGSHTPHLHTPSPPHLTNLLQPSLRGHRPRAAPEPKWPGFSGRVRKTRTGGKLTRPGAKPPVSVPVIPSVGVSLGPSSLITIECNKEGPGWAVAGGPGGVGPTAWALQYACVAQNMGGEPVGQIQLACADLNPTNIWNILPNCTLPVALSPNDMWRFGFQTLVASSTSSPPAVYVTSYTLASSTVTVTPPPSPSPLSLSCQSSGHGWPEGTTFMSEFECQLSNRGPHTITGLDLQCSDFHPTFTWNIDASCTLPAMAVAPGATWQFGFQTGPSHVSFFLKGFSTAEGSAH